MRSLHTKVVLLLSLCFLCCSMGLFAWQSQQRQLLNHAAYLLNVEAQKRTYRLLELISAPLTNYCQTVVQQKNLTDFLAAPLALPEELDGAWIFDNNGARLYTQRKRDSITLTWADIREQHNKKNSHFFVETPQGLLELYRASLPQDAGVVFAGKLWTPAVLKQIEGIMGSTATLYSRSHAPRQDLDDKAQVQLEVPLDPNTPNVTLHLSFRAPSLQMQHEAFQATPIWLFLFSTALLFVLSIALYHWISFPLKRLTTALREESLEPLAALKPDTQEVHELAGMVRTFFAQRQTIQQNRDLLEARVEERTQELSDTISSMSETQARLKAVLANLPVVVFALDEQAKVTFFEGQGMKSIDIVIPQVVGRSVYRHFPFRRTSEYGRYIKDVLAGEKRAWTMPLGSRCFDVQCSPLRGENNQVVGVIGVALDVTERVRFEDRLVHQAKHDALTGLPNRHFFQERLEQALAQATCDSRQVALLFLDLDNFKLVNDTLGHEAGDQLLQQITLRINGLLGPGRMLARLGGDEFTILVEHFASPTSVEQLAERIRMVMEESFLLESQEIFCRSSVGVVYSTPESTVGEMLRNADIAMYRSKEKGKGRHTTFDESMNLHLQERLALESDLRHALQNDELMLYYQPIISLESGLMVGVEALARWEHPRLGTILPSRFVAIAEESGLSSSLDYWALHTACRQFGIWNKQIETPLNISVNISTRQFQRSDLDRAVQMILADTELDPQKLTLEITEGVMMQDPIGASSILGRLKALGVQIAIDDFGTGYSSMAYLSNLPINTLKIDRSFITHMTDQKENVAIVEAIIHLARALSLKVTSEGVETAEQVKVLQWLKCHQAQGYFYSKPLTQSQLETLIFQPMALKKAA